IPMTAANEATQTLAARSSFSGQALVRVVGARATPAVLRLSGAACLVGSARDCDLVSRDPAISRAHLELSAQADGIFVRDLGSRNGPFYLGQRIERMVLAPGASLSLGGARLTIEADDPEPFDETAYEGESYRGILGASPAMRRLFGLLQR